MVVYFQGLLLKSLIDGLPDTTNSDNLAAIGSLVGCTEARLPDNAGSVIELEVFLFEKTK